MLALHFSFCLFHYSNMTQISQQKKKKKPVISTYSKLPWMFFQYVSVVFKYMLAAEGKTQLKEIELQCTEKIR